MAKLQNKVINKGGKIIHQIFTFPSDGKNTSFIFYICIKIEFRNINLSRKDEMILKSYLKAFSVMVNIVPPVF